MNVASMLAFFEWVGIMILLNEAWAPWVIAFNRVTIELKERSL